MGGTFDPIHLGHLAIAESAREALGLERVLFLPAAVPPHKPGSVSAPAADRAAMVDLAIAGNPAFEVSRIDARSGGAVIHRRFRPSAWPMPSGPRIATPTWSS